MPGHFPTIHLYRKQWKTWKNSRSTAPAAVMLECQSSWQSLGHVIQRSEFSGSHTTQFSQLFSLFTLTQHTMYSVLIHCSLPLLASHNSLFSLHSQLTAPCLLLPAHYSVLTSLHYHSLLTLTANQHALLTRHSQFTSHNSLLTTHNSLLTTHFSLLTSRYSHLTSHHSLSQLSARNSSLAPHSLLSIRCSLLMQCSIFSPLLPALSSQYSAISRTHYQTFCGICEMSSKYTSTPLWSGAFVVVTHVATPSALCMLVFWQCIALLYQHAGLLGFGTFDSPLPPATTLPMALHAPRSLPLSMPLPLRMSGWKISRVRSWWGFVCVASLLNVICVCSMVWFFKFRHSCILDYRLDCTVFLMFWGGGYDGSWGWGGWKWNRTGVGTVVGAGAETAVKTDVEIVGKTVE